MTAKPDGPLPRWVVRALGRLLGPDAEWVVGDIEERVGTRGPRSLRGRWRLLIDLSTTTAWALWRHRPRSGGTMRPEGWREDLALAVRALAWRPAYATGVVLTLALGIGTLAAAFTIVDGVVLRPLPLPEPDRLVRVYRTGDGAADLDFSAAQLEALAGTAAGEGGIGGFSRAGRILRIGEEGRDFPRSVAFARVTEGFFEALGATPRLGRLFAPAEARDGAAVVVLSESIWRSAFGARASALGTVVHLDEQPHTVIGVLATGSGFPEDAALWRPLTPAERADDDPEIVVVARLPRDVSATAFEAVLGAATEAARASAPDAWQASGTRAVRLQNAVLGDAVPRALLVLLVSSALVFLVALTNAAGLQLLRAMEARHDASVRIALGGSVARVVRGLLAESLLLAAAGTALGLSLALVSLPMLRALSPGAVPRLAAVELDLRVSLTMAAIALVGSLAGGLGPALSVARRAGPGTGSAGRTLAAGVPLRSLRSLVAVQLGLTTVLVISAGLLTASLRRMIELPRGFDSDGLVVVPLAMSSATGSLTLFQRELLDRVGRIPGVVSAAVSQGVPGLGTGMRLEMIGIEDLPVPAGRSRTGYLQTVSPGFFATLRLPILEGRPLPSDRDESAGAAVVNRAFARAFLSPAPWVGQRFTRSATGGEGRRVMEVVGVAADVATAPGEAPPAVVYVSTEAVPIYKNLLVRLDPGTQAIPTIELVHEAISGVDPEQPVNVAEGLDDALGAYGARTRFHARLMSIFGALALSLAAVGVYGVAAYGASQRRAELGLRRALGARRSGVVTLVLGRSLGTSLLGIACGAAGAWGVSRVLRSLLFEVSPFDPVIYLAGAAGLSLVAVMAALAPAVRVARDEAGLSRLLREG